MFLVKFRNKSDFVVALLLIPGVIEWLVVLVLLRFVVDSLQIKINLSVLVGFLPAPRAEWVPQLSVPKSHGGESWTLKNMDNPDS